MQTRKRAADERELQQKPRKCIRLSQKRVAAAPLPLGTKCDPVLLLSGSAASTAGSGAQRHRALSSLLEYNIMCALDRHPAHAVHTGIP